MTNEYVRQKLKEIEKKYFELKKRDLLTEDEKRGIMYFSSYRFWLHNLKIIEI